jgi:hypothetical protein
VVAKSLYYPSICLSESERPHINQEKQTVSRQRFEPSTDVVHYRYTSFFSNIMLRVEPLLCNDSEMGGYIRAVLGNGSVNTFPLLCSRFLIMQQLDCNNGDVFSAWSVPRCYKQGTSLVGSSVLYGRLWRESRWSRYQETSSNRLTTLDFVL